MNIAICCIVGMFVGAVSTFVYIMTFKFYNDEGK